jgi:hypothetical protein
LVSLTATLLQFGAPATALEQAKTLGPDEFLFFGTPPARIDVLRSIPGIVDFDAAFARAVLVDIGGAVAPVIGLDDLRLAKQAAGRPQDLRDLAALARAHR